MVEKGHGDVYSTSNKTDEQEAKHDPAQQNMELFIMIQTVTKSLDETTKQVASKHRWKNKKK